jgi:hypothetical protein
MRRDSTRAFEHVAICQVRVHSVLVTRQPLRGNAQGFVMFKPHPAGSNITTTAPSKRNTL